MSSGKRSIASYFSGSAEYTDPCDEITHTPSESMVSSGSVSQQGVTNNSQGVATHTEGKAYMPLSIHPPLNTASFRL